MENLRRACLDFGDYSYPDAAQRGEFFVDQSVVLVAAAIDEFDVEFVKYIYHAPALMPVGHNPGLEELIYRLANAPARMPTSAIAQLDLGDQVWVSIRKSCKTKILAVWRPKEVGTA